jgi:hypothetical protein
MEKITPRLVPTLEFFKRIYQNIEKNGFGHMSTQIYSSQATVAFLKYFFPRCSTRGEQMSLHSVKFHSNQLQMKYFAPSLDQAWSYLGAFVRTLKKKIFPGVAQLCRFCFDLIRILI